jgi:hypothetical protein
MTSFIRCLTYIQTFDQPVSDLARLVLARLRNGEEVGCGKAVAIAAIAPGHATAPGVTTGHPQTNGGKFPRQSPVNYADFRPGRLAADARRRSGAAL